MTKVGEEVKADCPSCGRKKWALVVAVVQDHQSDGQVWSNKTHTIVQCPACKGYVHRTDFVFSEDKNQYEDENGEWIEEYDHTIEQWPAVSAFGKAPPTWLDQLSFQDRTLYQLLRDTYVAVENDLRVYAAVGIRTTFDRASQLLAIDPGLSFGDKLEELIRLQHIGPLERDQLAIATDAGSAAAHRGWSPSPDELKIALDVVEAFVYRTLVLPEQAKRLKDSIPKRGVHN